MEIFNKTAAQLSHKDDGLIFERNITTGKTKKFDLPLQVRVSVTNLCIHCEVHHLLLGKTSLQLRCKYNCTGRISACKEKTCSQSIQPSYVSAHGSPKLLTLAYLGFEPCHCWRHCSSCRMLALLSGV